MISKSWPGRSVLACGTISLVLNGWLAAQPAGKAPAIALLDAADSSQWETFAKEGGWRVIVPEGSPAGIDQRVQAVQKAVQQAIAGGTVDPARVYLAGRGSAAAAVFYAISRVPDLWAAGVALGGSPQAAIDSGLIFTANFTNVPVLWVSAGADDEAQAAKLKSDGLNLEWRGAAGVTNGAILEWLTKHRREEFPPEVDCETNSPVFARCYWIEMTKFDPEERNDVLASTRMRGGSGASLDLGGFGFKTDEPGPGVLVSFLPEKYSGPLKMGDRIVALDGRPVENARQFVATMAKITEEKPTVATIQRGKERVRLETRIVLPRRDSVITARVQGKYSTEDHEILVISRTVKEMKVTIPPEWAAGSKLRWNGLTLDKIETPGCLLLVVEKELLYTGKCP